MHNELIKDLGEKEVIKRLSQYMPEDQTSDDCACLEIKNNNLLINTDLMVEGSHFNEEIICPKDLGWKAVTSNLSDLVSSGCKQNLGINIGLVLPPSTPWLWVKELYEGMNQALNKFGGSILGGDCSKGESKVVGITAIGIQGELKLRRYCCKPKEILLTTGIHGLSKLGYLLKSNKIGNKHNLLSENLIKKSVEAFCRPEPKSKILNQIIIARTINDKTEIGCTDSSDGLYQALLDLTHGSKCKAIVDFKKFPRHFDWPKGDNWDEYYLLGGEDYELIFSLPRDWADKLMDIEKSVTEIGYLVEGKPSIEFKNYRKQNLSELTPFSHF